MDLGAPIGSHGAGHGVGGGHGIANAENTQAGKFAKDEFNSGVGGQHASGDIPRGTPIADRFSGNTPEPYGQSGSIGTSGRGLGGEKFDNALDEYSGEHRHGHSHTHGQSGEAVSGAYSGGSTGDALTGQSGHTTGSGVGKLAENLRGSSGEHHHSHHHHEGAGVGAAVGAGAAGIGGKREYDEAYGHSGSAAATSAAPLTRGEGVAGLGSGMQPGVGGDDGSTGIGPNSAEGEAYTNSRREPGYGNLGEGGHSHSHGHHSGAGVGAGIGAGAAGVGAGELYESRDRSGQDQYSTGGSGGAGSKIAEGGLSGSGGNGVNERGTGGGKYGRAEHDSSIGQPLSKPKDLDTGNPHSLVFDKASGKYIHRRDIEGPNHGSRA